MANMNKSLVKEKIINYINFHVPFNSSLTSIFIFQGGHKVGMALEMSA